MAFHKAREEYKWKQWKDRLKEKHLVTLQELVKEVGDTDQRGYLAGQAPLTMQIILLKTFGYRTKDIAGIQCLLYLPGKENFTWCVMVKSAGCKYTYGTERRNRWRTEILPS